MGHSFNRIIWLIAFIIISTTSVFAQKAKAVNKVSITVADLDRSVEFYTTVLPFKQVKAFKLSGKEIQRLFGIKDKHLTIQVVQLALGSEVIELMEFETKLIGRPIPHTSRSNDLWFQHIAIVVSDMDKAYQQVAKHKVEHVSTAPQTLPDYIPAASGISAFYFRDPDDHNLELIYFPKGKGNPKWQNNEGKVFLGIDHSAIGIEETDASLAFYQDVLGLKVAGNSENYGPEQERLNQVFGARLLITGLHGTEGFGLEFLDYIAPPGGKSYPSDSSPVDLWHWHTSIKVASVDAIYQTALEQDYTIISKGVVSLSDTSLAVKKGLMVRGPDGHAMFLYE